MLQRPAISRAEFPRPPGRLGVDAGEGRAVHGVGSSSGGFRRRVGYFSSVGGIAYPEAECGAASGDAPFGSGFTDDPDLPGPVVRESEAFVELEAPLPWPPSNRGAD